MSHEGGLTVVVPAGPIQFDGPREKRTDASRAPMGYLSAVLSAEFESAGASPCEVRFESRLQPGARVVIERRLERRADPAAAPTLYREAPPSILVAVGDVKVRVVEK